MTKKIVQEYVADEDLAIRPDFFREPDTRYTGGDLPWMWEEDGMIVRRSAVWSAPGCHNGCGVKLYTDKETGAFVKLEGDEENPYYQGRLCARCIAMAEAIYHPDRVLYPMKRDPKDRGKDKWERISWDEAYDMVYEKFSEIKAKYGGRAIVFSMGTGRGTQVPLCRLAYAFGSVQYSYFLSGNSCYVPRVGATTTVTGSYSTPDFSQYFIDRYDHDGWVAPTNIFVWGNNPIISNADGNIGHWVVDCMKRGSKLVVIDPKLTWLAAKADLWMQIHPGTDAAVAQTHRAMRQSHSGNLGRAHLLFYGRPADSVLFQARAVRHSGTGNRRRPGDAFVHHLQLTVGAVQFFGDYQARAGRPGVQLVA